MTIYGSGLWRRITATIRRIAAAWRGGWRSGLPPHLSPACLHGLAFHTLCSVFSAPFRWTCRIAAGGLASFVSKADLHRTPALSGANLLLQIGTQRRARLSLELTEKNSVPDLQRGQDSNLDRWLQRPWCYRYTTPPGAGLSRLSLLCLAARTTLFEIITGLSPDVALSTAMGLNMSVFSEGLAP